MNVYYRKIGTWFEKIVEAVEHFSEKLPELLSEFLWFGIKQGWACLFGALLLVAILLTGNWSADLPVSRYDFLFVYAVGIQLALFLFKLESWREVCVIFLFHLMATAMELFKTSDAIGSWAYPEDSVMRIGNVPVFTGFMYSAVGSFMARAWRSFEFSFEKFPPLWLAVGLAVLSYGNFFTHHYLPDIRWVLIAVSIIAFFRTKVHFRPKKKIFKMPLLLSFCLIALFIWIAENLGTLARAWQYPDQKTTWEMVSFSKFIAWYLLMQLSFVLIYGLRAIEASLHKRERNG